MSKSTVLPPARALRLILALSGAALLTTACGSDGLSGTEYYRRHRRPHRPPATSPSTSPSTPISSSDDVIGDQALAANPNVGLGVPRDPASGAHVMISRKQYVVSWNETTRALDWAAWRVTSGDLGSTDRQNDFATDPELEGYLEQQGQGLAVSADDYRGTCLDRGHQVPSADRTASVVDNSRTFLMSNMLPQTAYLNRGLWEHLETYSRRIARKGGAVYVFAGPIYSGNVRRIGHGKGVAVPAKNFKIVVQVPQNGAQPQVVTAAIFPNVTSKGTDPMDDRSQACADQSASSDLSYSDDWKQYAASVADIEAQSGVTFDFLPH